MNDMSRKPLFPGIACPGCEVVAVPKSELVLLWAVFRFARKWLMRKSGMSLGSTEEARNALMKAVDEAGDPAKMRTAPLLDGGSSSRVTEPQMVSPAAPRKASVRPAVFGKPQPRRQTGRVALGR